MRLMNGKPMICYTVEAAIASQITDYNYVNTDSREIIEFVRSNYPVMGIYERDPLLADDKAQSDDFNADIMRKLEVDTLIMVNPVCPLIDAVDIRNALSAYIDNDCDTLITSTSTKMQTFCDGQPVNISIEEPLAPSQHNPVITILNWAVTIWDAKLFLKRIENNGYAVWGEKLFFHDIDYFKAVKVSEEQDFIFAERLIQLKALHPNE